MCACYIQRYTNSPTSWCLRNRPDVSALSIDIFECRNDFTKAKEYLCIHKQKWEMIRWKKLNQPNKLSGPEKPINNTIFDVMTLLKDAQVEAFISNLMSVANSGRDTKFQSLQECFNHGFKFIKQLIPNVDTIDYVDTYFLCNLCVMRSKLEIIRTRSKRLSVSQWHTVSFGWWYWNRVVCCHLGWTFRRTLEYAQKQIDYYKKY